MSAVHALALLHQSGCIWMVAAVKQDLEIVAELPAII